MRCRDLGLPAVGEEHRPVSLDATLPSPAGPPKGTANYGAGFPGTNGVPSLTSRADPVLGSTLTLDLANSYGASTVGLLFVGFQRTQIPTRAGASRATGRCRRRESIAGWPTLDRKASPCSCCWPSPPMVPAPPTSAGLELPQHWQWTCERSMPHSTDCSTSDSWRFVPGKPENRTASGSSCPFPKVSTRSRPKDSRPRERCSENWACSSPDDQNAADSDER